MPITYTINYYIASRHLNEVEKENIIRKNPDPMVNHPFSERETAVMGKKLKIE